MENIKKMDEKELRNLKSYWPKNEKELLNYINSLVNRKHDYGTCVYAIALSAVATFNYVAGKLGCTGFQAGCADLDILRRTRNMEDGFMILNYNNLLYPQTFDDEHFPSKEKLLKDNIKDLKERVKKLIKENENNEYLHLEVKKHWQNIIKE